MPNDSVRDVFMNIEPWMSEYLGAKSAKSEKSENRSGVRTYGSDVTMADRSE